MRVSVADTEIEVTIKNLDFSSTQNLLLCCKSHANLHPAASAKLRLENVTNINSCGIAAISLIADWMPGGFEITLSQCSREVHQWIDYCQGKDFLSTPPNLSCSLICTSCFDNNDYLSFGDSVHSSAQSEC
ncbi:hypothetical protein [Methylicorpusculum sp.]|uniref:hypothetical protein n=1 Tax=Methylicorpusculum sp. TaxID=2713644 RepID=UPI00271CE63D|nr:hypothetical protein [Methylicorpusculum sp.]MDO8845176.1 hypothetical protein [Methylicorpusculum sp.]